ncbi:efflux RND transporter permease subunit [Brevibacillus humidisoli]|uniref:efflux RND transporter permease subunit n=1 Tax=Brevibacillus humidisoli TaxID=2895522 RepID=UPI001E31A015|nr:efflux RND transporter permease subunit [Brevibacillus humidisoli]UFJ40229.1 efflux RND transporter permease subunit [Brevibacillus humidisoli]
MISYIVKKRKITLLFFTMLLMIGSLSFLQLPRQEMPEIVVNMATVTTVYPGASPEKVEQTVTKKLEEKINELQGLKSIQSTSSLGVSSIIIEAENGVDPKQKWDELRKKVKDAEADLPEDAHQPVINDDLNRTFIQTFAIVANSTEQLYSLRDTLENWKEQLRTIPNVADVTIQGLPEQEVRIDVDTQKLQQYAISWTQVLGAVQAENERVPLGDLDVGERTYQLKLSESRDVQRLEDVIVSKSREGFPIYLKDVARVVLTTEKINSLSYYNGKPSVSISINAEFGSDVPSLQEKVDDMVENLEETLPVWAEFHSIFTQNEQVQEMFGDLSREMLIAIVAVLLVCTLGLNFTTSFVVALAIPISLSVGMLLLPPLGISLNMITIAALIIVLGILVDDAVVVNDNIERRLSVLRERPFAAAVNGAREVSISIITATLATIASFGPLFFLEGNVGQFIKPVPVIITSTMLASMVMSLTIIPIYRQWREERSKRGVEGYRKPAGLLGKQISSLTDWYAQRLMPKVLAKPLRTGLIGVLIGTLAYGLIPFTPVQLFPPDDRAQFLVNVRLPVGSSLQETDRVVSGVSDWIRQQEGIEAVAAYAGGSAPKMFSGDTEVGTGIELGQLVVTVDQDRRDVAQTVEEWRDQFRQLFPEASVIPVQLEAGPPVGSPVVIRIFGDDLDTLRKLSQQVKDIVADVPGTFDVQDNLGIERYAIEFEVNKALMDEKMVSAAELNRTLRLMNEGITVSEFDTGTELIDINLYADTTQIEPFAAFQRLSVTNAMSQQIPLSEIVEMKPGFAIKSIPHHNLSRSVTVYSDVKGRTATEVMQEIRPLVEKISFPDGYRWEVAGETSEQTDVFIDMGKLSVVVVFLIVILIAMQFYSLSLPLLVMSTVYLSSAGSLIGLFVTQTPLGFMTMMGVISLAGIVVRNGIVLIEFVEEARREGVELKQAVIQAGEARFRPILLTTMTAVAGLMPLALSGDVLFEPMAITIIFGLIFSTMLTLIVVPSFYTVLAAYKEKRKARKAARLGLDGPSTGAEV